MEFIRNLLRKILPFKAYNRVRYCWWKIKFYFPRRIASSVVRRSPRIKGCSVRTTSELVHRLRSINVFAPTPMCRAMSRHGSDKGQGWHNYSTVYFGLFGSLRNQPLRILELGLGTNNPSLPSSMGVNGVPGASLRGWRDFFRRGLIFGADIDRDILFQEDRIKTFYCDQCDSVAIRRLWMQPELQTDMDIIIDDGLHTFEANNSFLDESLGHLKSGGYYVVEDILQEDVGAWINALENGYPKRFPKYEFVLIELPNASNHHDNNLLVIHRP